MTVLLDLFLKRKCEPRNGRESGVQAKSPHIFSLQVMSTMFLLMMVFAIFDSRNLGVPKGLEPVVIGLLIIVLSSSLGLNSGCAMNPARDLSPRLFTALAGWGFDVFR